MKKFFGFNKLLAAYLCLYRRLLKLIADFTEFLAGFLFFRVCRYRCLLYTSICATYKLHTVFKLNLAVCIQVAETHIAVFSVSITTE